MFLHNYNPSSILLNIGPITIYWYGLLITLGIILGFFVFYKLARKAGIQKNHIFDLTFWLIIWGVIGARLYHVLSEIGYYFSHPLEIFYIWNGGLGIYGAVAAGVLVIIYFGRKNKKSPLLIMDLLAPSLALALAIGRWGNYFNQELYGLPSNLPWSIPIDFSNRLFGFEHFTYFHPVFLYESLFCFLLFIILIILINQIKTKPGYIFLLYLFLYSAWRFLIEFLRIDPQPFFLSLRLGQWTSLVIVILSIVLFFILKNQHNKINK